MQREQPRASSLVREVLNSKRAVRERAKGLITHTVFSKLALEQSYMDKESNRGYDTDRSRLLKMISSILPGLESHKALTRERGMPTEDRWHHLKIVEKLNRSLRDVIDNEHFDGVASLVIFITEYMMSASLSSEDIRDNQVELKTIIEGMRHEIAAESVLSEVDGVDEVRSATAKEDLAGKDVIVTYKGREIGLDIKASQISADNSTHRNRPDYGVIWSGVTSWDFDNRLILTSEEIDNLKPHYQSQLDNILERSHHAIA